MKARDRRRKYAILTLLASIAVAVATALSVTYVALGFLFVYIKDRFPEWNEKRKAEMEAKKRQQEVEKPGLIDKIKAKFGKSVSKEVDEQPVSDSEYTMSPPQVDSNKAFIMNGGSSYIPDNGYNVPQYPNSEQSDYYEEDLDTISATSNKKRHLFSKK